MRQIENQQKAITFYRHNLLTKLGMDRFKLLIKLKKRNHRKAEQFQRHIVIKWAWRQWQLHVHQIWDKRKCLADQHYHQKLKMFILNLWKEV